MLHIDEKLAMQLAPEYLEMAYAAATESPDPSNQNGAVLFAHELKRRLTGFNHFPPGIQATPELLANRTEKLTYIEHAERDLVARAAFRGISLYNAIVFCPWFACAECARMLALSGVGLIVGHKPRMDTTPESWKASVDAGNKILDAAKVTRLYYEEPLNLDFTIKVNGQDWRP
jgi:dCMP deaminase